MDASSKELEGVVRAVEVVLDAPFEYDLSSVDDAREKFSEAALLAYRVTSALLRPDGATSAGFVDDYIVDDEEERVLCRVVSNPVFYDNDGAGYELEIPSLVLDRRSNRFGDRSGWRARFARGVKLVEFEPGYL